MNRGSRAYYLLIGFFCFFIFQGIGQNQKKADSLALIYAADSLSGSKKMELLRQLAYHETKDLDLSLSYAEELIGLATKDSNFRYQQRGFIQKGNTLRMKGDLQLALDAFFKSVEIARETGFLAGEGFGLTTVADTYSEQGDSKNAEFYYEKGIAILRQTNDSVSLATALLNAGDEYSKNGKYDLALRNFEESGDIFKLSNFLIGTAYNKGNIGMVLARQGKHDEATSSITEAVEMLEDLEDYYAISDYYTYMSDIYAERKDWRRAFSFAEQSLNMAIQRGLKEQVSASSLKLSEIYEALGNQTKALEYYKTHIKYRDSVINLETVRKMADQQMDFEVSQKQIEVNLLEKEAEIQALESKRQRNIILGTIVALVLISLLLVGLYRRNQFIKKTKAIIELEKNRSDNLLLNILPEETAQELKDKGKVEAKRFESVTVLFTDFKGFTQFAENLPPEELVKSIDYYYSKFDEIVGKHGLEKIKTVGDAYMCAGGLPFPSDDHPQKMIMAAQEMLEFVKFSKDDDPEGQTRFDVRIGINTGPVVAGVVGTKKFAYDIWGDTVNVASRMETSSEPGKINISEYTYKLVKNDFECEFRGKFKVKNHGKLNMYFVKGIQA
ncbi:MAG: tetratricopeptide repeat protein [Flavobacteriaceae bacterium]|nr:tetratricopeptide repeat protein [Flavobacteriaceae bacterium]